MDRRAWQATAQGVEKKWILLSDWTHTYDSFYNKSKKKKIWLLGEHGDRNLECYFAGIVLIHKTSPSIFPYVF